MQGFLDPAILFFVFGMAAGALKSNLEIPPQISRFLSLYLLMALGLKGGFALAESGLTAEVSISLGVGIALAVIVPALGYVVLRRFLNGYDAAAIAATYGSVSAVTFITAVQYLDQRALPYGGHMAAAMALMESPAIILAVLLANWVRQHDKAPGQSAPLGKVLHESLTDGAQLLLLGAMVVGIAQRRCRRGGDEALCRRPVQGHAGLLPARHGLAGRAQHGAAEGQVALAAGLCGAGPLVHAALALALCAALGVSAGNAALLMVLAASASYIAVPAVVRQAIPEANPSLYFGMSLGLTFPFNILLGIPLYVHVAHRVLG